MKIEREGPITEPRHPIQVVARRSGLTPDVLRAWEKRYGVVEPRRSAGGRRLYSNADIQRLVLLRQATDGGRRIGDVAQLPTEALIALVKEDLEIQAPVQPGIAPTGDSEGASRSLDECLAAVHALDDRRLESALEAAVILLTPATLVERVIAPLMERIGDLWWEGKLGPAQEHLASSIVRHTLAKVSGSVRPSGDALCVVVATPARQRHEIGAALVATTAACEGWRVVYMGADLPASEIAAAAERAGAHAVALSIVHPDDDPDLAEELRGVREALGNRVTIIAGGRAAPAYRSALDEIGATILSDIESLRALLRELRKRKELTGAGWRAEVRDLAAG